MAETKQKKFTNPLGTVVERLYDLFDNKVPRYLVMAAMTAFLIYLPLSSSRFTQEIMTNLFFM
jgi:hypothetical protein